MTQVERLLRQGVSAEDIVKQLNEAQEKIKKEEIEAEKAKAEAAKKQAKVEKARATLVNAYKTYLTAVTGEEVTKEMVREFLNTLSLIEKTIEKKDKLPKSYSFTYDSRKDDPKKLIDELDTLEKIWGEYFGK